ncbi:hypothetical protein V8C44DRAFT_224834 [Trichoderma aethiopicum]
MSTAVAMGRPLNQQVHGDLREQPSDACGVRRQTIGTTSIRLPICRSQGFLLPFAYTSYYAPLSIRGWTMGLTCCLLHTYRRHVSYPLSTSLKVKAVLRSTISVVLTVTRYLLERHKVHPHPSWYLLLRERYSLFPAFQYMMISNTKTFVWGIDSGGDPCRHR